MPFNIVLRSSWLIAALGATLLVASPAWAQDALEGASVVSANLPHDLSPWAMFMSADYVVKAVMIGLAFASVLTWIILVAKVLEIAGATRRMRRTLRLVSDARSLDEALQAARKQRGTGTLLLRAAEGEVLLSQDALDNAGGDGLKDRVASRLARLQAAAGRRLSRGTGVLATIA